MTNSPEVSDYQAFINAKAERFKTPQALIDQVVTDATNETPLSTERLIHGEVNEVYKITTESNKLILRIAHATGERAAKERWAIEQSAKEGVPVPEIVNLSTLETEDGPRTFCLQKQIEGIPFDQIPDIAEEEKHKITIEGGKILSQIHAVKTEGFGLIDGEGVGEFKTIQESLTEWSRDPDRLFEIADVIEMDRERMKKGLQILEGVAKEYNFPHGSLLHQDYGPKHFLVQDGRINGIIDFENAKSGDPIEEFARWHYYFNNEYPLEWLLEGYPDKSRINHPNFKQLLHAWRINLGFGAMDYYENDKNHIGLNHCKQELIKDLDYFSIESNNYKK
ncbi:MAG: phosphotransferase family protein [Candidatus Bilamarchaeum sp.]